MISETMPPRDVSNVFRSVGDVHRELVVVHRLRQRAAEAQRGQQRQRAP